MTTLPPPSRGSSGVSRLALMQARFQAKQMEEKETKLLTMLEERQEEQIQRVAYGRDSANSANSLSSNNSSNSMGTGVGQRPGRVRQMFEERRRQQQSPVGWDKSYPLRPVGNATVERPAPMFRKNHSPSVAAVAAAPKTNKYSGNYGPRAIKNRGVSLDRNGALSRSQYNNFNNATTSTQRMLRTRSFAQLGHSSGEDSYGSSSRPPSSRGMYARAQQQHNDVINRNLRNMSHSHHPVYSSEDSPPHLSPPNSRSASYTREYIRNLPSSSTITRGRSLNRMRRDPSPSSQIPRTELSSYSSQSSEKSDQYPGVPAKSSDHLDRMRRSSSNIRRDDTFTYESRPRINTKTFRKSRSPGRSSRSVSHSPVRNEMYHHYEDNVNNNEAAALMREKEEEKRRLQAEMRRREQELLNKIKEQQKQLESVKQEKTKVERELQRERAREEQKQRETERQQRLQRNTSNPRSPSKTFRRPPRMEDEDEDEVDRSPVSPTRRFRPAASRSGSNASVPPAPAAPPAPPAPKPAAPKPPRPKPAVASPKKTAAAKPPATRRSIFAQQARNDLSSCPNCGRNFAEDRIQKHIDICVKTSTKKRKTFDMTKKRTQGTDAESYVRKGRHLAESSKTRQLESRSDSKKSKEPAPKKSDWRKKREDFINALRAAKEAQRHLAAGGRIQDLPPPPPSDTSDYVQCKHCGRRFNEGVAERHIPKCANIRSNKR